MILFGFVELAVAPLAGGFGSWVVAPLAGGFGSWVVAPLAGGFGSVLAGSIVVQLKRNDGQKTMIEFWLRLIVAWSHFGE